MQAMTTIRLSAVLGRCSSHRLATVVLALAGALAGDAVRSQTLNPVTVARGLSHPWGLAFLPSFESDGRMLVTERAGRLRIVNTKGEVGPPLDGVPTVDARGQGGLLDVVLDPQFAENRWVYLSYSEPGPGGNSTAVARAKLDATGLQGRLGEVQVIFRQAPKFSSTAHFGSRLVFARDGRLFITLGDRFSRRDDAQTLGNHHGKVIRIEADGKVPPDNPFVSRSGALPEIWSFGHRNVQGAALHPQTAELWTHEHGPQGGDEVNVSEAGRNYGWPIVTYGAEYITGRKIGEGTEKPGIEHPLVHWVPSIAPSGMAFLTSDRYPGWKGDLFVGALRAQVLVRLSFDGRRVLKEERLLQDYHQRIRDVRQAPDGWLYLLTDSDDGRVVRLER
jgi:glucose/arabinose dehydrogenase